MSYIFESFRKDNSSERRLKGPNILKNKGKKAKELPPSEKDYDFDATGQVFDVLPDTDSDTVKN